MIKVLKSINSEKICIQSEVFEKFNLIFFIPQHISIKFWFAYSSNLIKELSLSILYTEIIESINKNLFKKI